MLRHLNIVCILLIGSTILSCKKYLDIIPDDVATIEYAFRNRNEAINYLATCYNYQQVRSSLQNNPGFSTSGEIIDLPETGFNPFGSGDQTFGFRYLRGIQNPEAPILDHFAGYYQAIRKCNTFLENVGLPPDLGAAERIEWTAEVKFLKAYYFFSLLRQYGPIPLMKTNLPINTPTDVARVPRDPADSVFAYVVALLDEAIPNLPPIRQATTEYRRATQIMALALKAKALVTQASPLFNGDADQAQLKNTDGTPLFAQASDPNRWQVAANACKAAIDAATENGIQLYTSTPTIPVPPAIKQQFSIQDPLTGPQAYQIPENIWPGASGTSSSFIEHMTPNIANLGSMQKGKYQFAVPLSMAELFYTKNGIPIEEDKTWDYAGRNTLTAGTAATKFYIQPSYSTVKFHFNREPRFYADLAFDGGICFGFGVTDSTRLLYQNSLQGATNNVTGYWPKKLIPYSIVINNTSANPTWVNYIPPVMRLADLYLLYAEALNEASGPNAEVYKYIDLIRERAGLPDVLSAWTNYSNNPSKPLSKDGLRSIIRQERRIELCFEGDIGWDLRRWKIYTGIYATAVQGWNFYFNNIPTAANYYRVTNVFTPVLSTKDYFWPIRQAMILNNNKLVQNIGW